MLFERLRGWGAQRPLWLALVVSAVMSGLLLWVWGFAYGDRVVPVGWSLALVAAVWFGRRWLIWALAALYAALVLTKMSWLTGQPATVVPSLLHLVNILVTALLVQLVLAWRGRLRQLREANSRLEASNGELAAREEQISRQNEELQTRTQELEQESQELQVQSEELEQQARELSLRAQEVGEINARLNQRERTLHLLLHAAGKELPETQMMGRICEAALEFFAGQIVAATVVEKVGSQVVLRSSTGLAPDAPRTIAFDKSLLALACQQRRAIEVRADSKLLTFQILRAADGRPFQCAYIVPLWLAEEPLGGLEVFSDQTAARWDEQQLQLLDWLAEQCSRLWQIIRLRQDLQRRVSELQDAQQKLAALNQMLEQRVGERTALAEQRARQLQALTVQLAQTEQRERRQLARLLHDHLQQLLVAAKLKLGVARRQHSDGPVLAALKEADELLDESILASRTLTVELSPPILYDSGLSAALQWLADRKRQKYGLEVTVDADPAADPDAEETAALLFSATRELLFNVVKHAGTKHARVTLKLDGPPGAQRVSLCVEDQGRGFDVESTGTAGTERFGLFSMRERLLAMGGDMQVYSQPGQGTSITLLLPRQPHSAHVPEKALVSASIADSPLPSRPRQAVKPIPATADENPMIRVLLADDHKILREGVAGLLREQPDITLVGEASDGQMALELARELQPDVVVMDVSMPRMNGIEATRRIRQEMPRVRVIGLSMHGGDHIAQSLRDAGAEAYVTKGGPSEMLISAIRGGDAHTGRDGSD